jgi:hypothetical protein
MMTIHARTDTLTTYVVVRSTTYKQQYSVLVIDQHVAEIKVQKGRFCGVIVEPIKLVVNIGRTGRGAQTGELKSKFPSISEQCNHSAYLRTEYRVSSE